MPHYEFFCPDCTKFFDRILSLVDYEEGEVLCPHCGSKTSSSAGPCFPPSLRRRAPENYVRSIAPKAVIDTGPLGA
jgi:putative FmdB family regulatory protein